MNSENSTPTPEEYEVRKKRLLDLRSAGVNPYPARFEKKNSVAEIQKSEDGATIQTAGRIMSKRDMGKLCFAHIQDFSSRGQIAFQEESLGKEAFNFFLKYFDVGDFIGVTGEVFTTHKGEKTLLVKKYEFLGKALRPLPEKWHGLKDEEARYRQRYLDLIANEETKQRFIFRSNFIKTIREFYWKEDFSEVETSTLMHSPTGASARPYVTHNNGLDIDVFLRISLELPLKELIVGGYEKVFEIGKVFRNEGFDPSHLPEHTHLEHYAAYWNFEDNIAFTERMFNYFFDTLGLTREFSVMSKEQEERVVNFTTPWERINFIDLIKKDAEIDLKKYQTEETLRAEIKKKNIEIEDMEKKGYASLIDSLYKKLSRPHLVGPVILYNYPAQMQPLARRSDGDAGIVEQFQVVVNGWEILKAYSELVDPADQKARFDEQFKAAAKGDEEAQVGDDEYILAMEHGMPPISGWGMGIDRILAILTQQPNLRDVVLFPLMRQKEREK